MSRQIEILVVDDSVVVRRMLSSVLDDDPALNVMGTAASGVIAIAKLSSMAPDCVVLDIEMPDMDGLATLRALRRTHPRLPVIMFSTLTERGATATLEALSLGANDYVTKPARAASPADAMDRVREQLVPKIKALCRAATGDGSTPGLRRARPAVQVPALSVTSLLERRPVPDAVAPTGLTAARSRSGGPTSRVDLLVLGASTGGPEALSLVLPGLPGDFPVPVVVVQHMPAVFTRMFAARLDRSCRLEVKEAEDGDVVQRGRILIAPGDRHLELRPEGATTVVRLTEAPAENFSRPSVDVTFRSAARVYGANVLAVVLTGMGSDGRRGAEALHRAGAQVVAQDEDSSVVWGMPSAVIGAGLAHRTLPLEAIARTVVATVAASRTPALGGAR